MTARDVIAQALALSEAVPPGPWTAIGSGVANGDHWYVCDADESIALISSQDGSNEDQRQPTAEFIAAARTLLPAFAKALGNVLAVVESSEVSDGPYRNVLHTTAIRRAITAALSEVTP